MIKQILVSFLLVTATMLGVACSSPQDAIDEAVQQTVEAQLGNRQDADLVTADPESTLDDATPESSATNLDEDLTSEVETASSTRANNESGADEVEVAVVDEAILGKWSGSPGLSVPSALIDYPHHYSSLTFYKDIVVFHEDEGQDLAFRYRFADEKTVELGIGVIGPIGIMEVVQLSPDKTELALLSYDSYETEDLSGSSTFTKIATVEHTDSFSIEEALPGEWRTSLDGEDFSVEFIAHHLELPEEILRYEFQEPNRLRMSNLYYPESNPNAEIAMPNEDTMILWFYDYDESEAYLTGTLILFRKSSPPPIVERPENEVLYPFVAGSGCGYIDKEGSVVIEARFGGCGDFSEGLAVVAPFSFEPGDYLNYFGYIDNSGRFVIEPQFVSAASFAEGLARVRDRLTGKIGYINETGEYVISPQYDNGGHFSDGLVYVDTLDPEWAAIIDRTGAVAFEATDLDLHSGVEFHDGLLEVDGGFVDRAGEYVISLGRLDTGSFAEGLAGVKSWDNSGCYYIDTEGETVIQTDFYDCQTFSEGLAAVYRDEPFSCGYIDKSGELAINIQYDQCGQFVEGRAGVLADGHSYYIDTEGNFIFRVPDDFEFANNFQYGLARIGVEDRWGYIDRDGNYILDPR